jgi:hypothetical protein
VTSPRLTEDEDAELRRLRVLSEFGAVSGDVLQHYHDLRERDRRREVRRPTDPTVATTDETRWS